MATSRLRWLRYGRIALAALSMLMLLAFVCHGVAVGEYWFNAQFGPAAARAWLLLSPAAAGVVLLLLVLTLVFGRVYCSVLCPLGILQDVIGWLTRRRCPAPGNHPRLRYGIAVVTIVLALCGWNLGLRLLDPASRFGGMVATLVAPLHTAIYNRLYPDDMLIVRPLALPTLFILGVLPLLLLTALVLWRRRWFCTTLCPVGTVLGLLAKYTPYPLQLTDACVKCGQCQKICPAGCIDLAEGSLDNERCLRCLKCLDACRFQAVGWGRPAALTANAGTATSQAEVGAPVATADANNVQPAEATGAGDAAAVDAAASSRVDLTRREVLVGAAGLSAMACVGAALLRPGGVLRAGAGAGAIYPPGAGSAARFAALCTGCQLCVRNCRGNVLRALGDGRSGLVHLVFDRGMCEFNCMRCSSICPTGALRPMTKAAKQRCRIGMAQFDPSLCVAVQDGVDCGACAEHCPTGALQMKDDGPGRRIPSLNTDLCIGCGSCEYPCPVRPLRAMRVTPVAIQVQADDPGEYFRRRREQAPLPKPAATGDDGWLL
ncbi:MAG: 4Fe-4S binding protein [Lentisphaeria bacterium]|nr:4Fe-4S binding protein [Lentisphaeria bacterium]